MKKGFTLTELLIVIALLMILFFIVIANVGNQLAKTHDVQRKADLNKFQKSFEEYYNDHYTYPPDTSDFSNLNCNKADSSLYLSKFPCDPTTRKPYLYVLGIPTAKDGYVLCAKLENLSDSDITRIGCDPVKGCGWKVGYNYCVGSGMLAINPVGIQNGGGPTSTPTPTVAPGDWACTNTGNCDKYGYNYAVEIGCPYTYDIGCENNGVSMCSDPANQCPQH